MLSPLGETVRIAQSRASGTVSTLREKRKSVAAHMPVVVVDGCYAFLHELPTQR